MQITCKVMATWREAALPPPGNLTSESLRVLKEPVDNTLLFVHFPDTPA